MNIVLVNIFFIMLVQLGLNWQASDCDTRSNLFQLAFILIYLIRMATQEAHNNKAIPPGVYKAITLFTSGCLLTALGVYESYVIAANSNSFEYDPKTKIGNLVCYQNRIVFVGEIIICFLTVIKDIVVVVMGNESHSSDTQSI